MSDLVGNPEDRFSYNEAQLFLNIFQLKSRRESCETKATASRNEFLLCMAAANAHHVRYFNKDLPSLMEVNMLNTARCSKI